MKDKGAIQAEALEIALLMPRCTLAITMGTGKTLIGLQYLKHFYTDTVKALVVAPKKSIFKTWKEEADKFNLSFLLPHLSYCTYVSLPKADLSLYDIVFLDECHNLLNSHDDNLSLYRNRILGLTGTPPRFSNSEKAIMIRKYCPIAYEYTVDEAVEDEILNDYQIFVHKIDLGTSKNIKVSVNGKTWYTSEKESYDYWTSRVDNAGIGKEVQIMRIMRMKALMGFLSKEDYVKRLLPTIKDKCIIFANTHEQAEKLCPNYYHSGFANREIVLDKFKNGEIMQMSAVLQLNEGVNIKNLKVGIIMHSYSSGSSKSNQRQGRLHRLLTSETAILHILVYKDTVDEQWCRDVLSNLDQNKINIV